MFSSFFSGGVPKFGFGQTARSGTPISIPPVKTFNIETSTDKRSRTLKHLLKLNHASFSILYNHLRFHNHTPHLLGSAYLLDATADQLNDIYEDASTNEGHEPWQESPSEIALHDYRDFLGHREYQRAWVDFFEDQLVLHGYEWKNVVAKFLFESGSKKSASPYPMFNCMTAGLGHPLIHLGYAYELDSREVAMEALGLVATCYDAKLASYMESSAPKTSTGNPLTYSTSNPFEVLARCNGDTRLDGIFDKPGGMNLTNLLADQRLMSIVLEHWAAWKITDPKQQFEQSQQLAIALLMSCAPSVGGHGYDFFLLHVLTTSHACRIIIPFLESQHHLLLLREWWLITLALYIAQARPLVKLDYITNFDLQGRDWSWAEKLAIQGKHRFDAHYVKGIRAIKEASLVWGDQNEFYLKAAVKFAGEFQEWEGFGRSEEDDEHVESETKRRRGSFS